eukprot:jgi/Botrbrau1/20756/Bobra.0900s0001.1
MFEHNHIWNGFENPKHTCSDGTTAASLRSLWENRPRYNVSRNSTQHSPTVEVGQGYQHASDKYRAVPGLPRDGSDCRDPKVLPYVMSIENAYRTSHVLCH